MIKSLANTAQKLWKSWEDFNKKVGLPHHPEAPYSEMPLMPYQNAFFKTVETTRYHKFHINKARQMGFSELILRLIAFRSDNRYKGMKVKLMAGTRSSTTVKLMDRLKLLFSINYEDEIANGGDSLFLELKNGTSYEGLPANPEALTGDTKIRCIVMDEAAKWDLQDDLPVMNSIMPIVDTNHSDLFLLSTPKGKRGFFYKFDLEDNDFMKLKYDIWQTENYLYSTEKIGKFLANKTIDVDQEYLNQYTAGSANVFGTVNIDPNLIAEDWDNI